MDTKNIKGREMSEVLAQARRFYHHVVNGGQLRPEDVSYMVSALEEAYKKLERAKIEE